jgi:hypothetical protein
MELSKRLWPAKTERGAVRAMAARLKAELAALIWRNAGMQRWRGAIVTIRVYSRD